MDQLEVLLVLKEVKDKEIFKDRLKESKDLEHKEIQSFNLLLNMIFNSINEK